MSALVATPSQPFADACAAVVDHLKTAIPLGYWSVSRFDGDRQLYLAVRDESYGTRAGDSHLWSDSLCKRMVDGEGPSIAPDAMSIPAYSSAGIAQRIDIGAYVGFPITRPDGQLFGTICGLDPEIQSGALAEHAPLLQLLATLLRAVLAADLANTDANRAVEAMQLTAETDALTGLRNRRGWDRHLAEEEERFRHFGDPAAIIVVDLDGLKSINDSLGHAAGDRTLRLAARTLRETMRTSDLLARLGGDEFGILAKATPAEAGGLVARLQVALLSAGVRASVGSAQFSISGGFALAWEQADLAMYAQKLGTRPGSASRSGRLELVQASRRSSE